MNALVLLTLYTAVQRPRLGLSCRARYRLRSDVGSPESCSSTERIRPLCLSVRIKLSAWIALELSMPFNLTKTVAFVGKTHPSPVWVAEQNSISAVEDQRSETVSDSDIVERCFDCSWDFSVSCGAPLSKKPTASSTPNRSAPSPITFGFSLDFLRARWSFVFRHVFTRTLPVPPRRRRSHFHRPQRHLR